MRQKTLKENSSIKDRLEYLYVEHAIIDQKDSSVEILRGSSSIPVPIASIACLILGPGVSITHAAIVAISDSGCLLVWSGERMRTMYATGLQENRNSRNILRQATYWADPDKHLLVVRRLYQKRFPDKDMTNLSIQQMQGAEGIRVKNIYVKYAKEYGVPWTERKYNRDDWEGQEDIQKALTIGNKLLYHVCHAAIMALGFSPVIGFIHTGIMRSFVYDIADLYKAEVVIPLAFWSISQGSKPEDMRDNVRGKMQEIQLLKRLERDLGTLFDTAGEEGETDEGALWRPEGNVESGRNYGHQA